MKSLILAEKPSVGRDIARVLHIDKKGNGYFEGKDAIVTWGLGHLVTLAEPEQYNKAYQQWKLDDLPMLPEPMKLEVIHQTGKQFHTVKELLFRNDIKEVVIATDAGREGELVARWILEKAGCKKSIKRLWISSVTDKAIREGFANLKDGHAYDMLYHAALSRAEADWLVGMNTTRALTCRYNASLSSGRVQTPTLTLIAERQNEIKNFSPVSYYGLSAKCSQPQISFIWKDTKEKSSQCFNKEKVMALKEKLSGEMAEVAEIQKSPKKTYSPLLYDLNELQRDANKRFGFSAKQTLDIMQRLYETHKILTYPRTDSRYLPSDIVDTLKERLEACAVGPYKALAMPLRTMKFSKKAFYIEDSKVTDHHAIIPTEQTVILTELSNDERKIYDLVVRRFLAVFYPPYEYEHTSIRLRIGNEDFFAKGNVVKQLGWKSIYENKGQSLEEEEEAGELPELFSGQKLNIKIEMTEGKTKPPALYNEASLLTIMEQKGLGTVATRADIIEKLFRSFLIEKQGKDLIVTSKGKQLLSLVPIDLKKPELTAQWEKKLVQISQGNIKRNEFMKEIRSYTIDLVTQIKTGEGTFRHDNLTNHKCPDCGKPMLLVKGKNSELLVCQDRECGYRQTIARTSNARCPVCHKKMVLRGEKEKQIFTCSCGYKEKLAAFEERRKKEGVKVSKKEVESYLKKQKQTEKESINNTLAQALSKLSLEKKE